MTETTLSRRTLLKAAGGAGIAAGAALPTSAIAAGEFDAARRMIGSRVTVSGLAGTALMELEDVIALPRRGRFAGELSARAPYVMVFRRLEGERLSDGTHAFGGEPLLVAQAMSADGQHRLEAVFN